MKQNEAIQDSRFKIGGIITGGGQEFGLRSGTENTPSIVGFAEAVRLVISNRGEESERVRGLKERFWAGLKKICPDAEVNGCRGENDCHSLPNILNVFFPKRLAEELLTKFDLAGLMASAGPACKSRSLEPSYVIEALGYSEERAKSSVRFSFGRPTTKKEVDSALAIIKKLLLR